MNRRQKDWCGTMMESALNIISRYVAAINIDGQYSRNAVHQSHIKTNILILRDENGSTSSLVEASNLVSVHCKSHTPKFLLLNLCKWSSINIVTDLNSSYLLTLIVSLPSSTSNNYYSSTEHHSREVDFYTSLQTPHLPPNSRASMDHPTQLILSFH